MENFSFNLVAVFVVHGEFDDFLEWPAGVTIVLMLSLVILTSMCRTSLKMHSL